VGNPIKNGSIFQWFLPSIKKHKKQFLSVIFISIMIYIDIELKKGTSQNKMAKSLGRSQGSISRELARNTGQRRWL
jgi:hypothetical protein